MIFVLFSVRCFAPLAENWHQTLYLEFVAESGFYRELISDTVFEVCRRIWILQRTDIRHYLEFVLESQFCTELTSDTVFGVCHRTWILDTLGWLKDLRLSVIEIRRMQGNSMLLRTPHVYCHLQKISSINPVLIKMMNHILPLKPQFYEILSGVGLMSVHPSIKLSLSSGIPDQHFLCVS